jgi:RNA polymerase sigma factor (sigma-70 family)
MVLRVCRRVLRHEQDAEDAFQATFLVLARHTGSIRKRDAVASWLYGVAYRTAMKAKRSAARRRNRETRLRDRAPGPAPGPTWDEVQAVLDEEIERLPDAYRSAFVLCVLEGKSGPQCAAALGIQEGTVWSRLGRARQLLRRRLVRRGIKLAAVLAARSVADSAAQAGVSAVLAHATVRCGLLVAAGETAAGVIPSHVAALAAGVTRAMSVTRAKIATAVLFALAFAAGAGVLAHQALPAGERPVASQKSEVRGQRSEVRDQKPEPASGEKGASALVSGRVVDPEGKPVTGAKVFFARYVLSGRDPAPPQAATDAQGHFRLRVSRAGYHDDSEKALWLRGAVVALGQGSGFGWVGADSAEKLTDITIRLARDVPIAGRVVDLQGKPVAGVSVRLRSIAFRQDGTGLQDFAEALRSGRVRFGWWNDPTCPRIRLEPGPLGLKVVAHTGADGTFRLTGISPECLVLLRFEGPTIETSEEYAITRPGPTLRLPPDKELLGSRWEVFHGTTFDHAAAPTRPIVGTVRDRDTGKPLAGVTIRSEADRDPGKGIDLQTTTDAEGRYRLVGLSRAAGHVLLAVPPAGQPYLRAGLTSPAAAGLDPVTLDFTLKRGVAIRGRVTDKETGRPVPALVTYFAFDDNAHLREAPGYRDSHSIEIRTGADGSFTLLGLPGRGLVAARAADSGQEGRYLMAVGADKIRGRREDGNFITHPNICDSSRYNTLAEVNPARGAEAIARDVVLQPGKTVTGTIVDEGGRPVKGASIAAVFGVGFRVKGLPTAQFRIPGIDPKHPRPFYFLHPTRNLGAAVLLGGDEPMPLTVRLQKCATITGRVVDDDGLPQTCWIMGYLHKGQLNITGGVGCGTARTDKDGRFRTEGVIPGLKIGLWAGTNPSFYDQHLVPELTLRPGEVRDLGDLKRKATE